MQCFLKVKPRENVWLFFYILYRNTENNVTLSSDVVVNNLIMFAYTQNYIERGLFSNLGFHFFFFFLQINLKLLSENDVF